MLLVPDIFSSERLNSREKWFVNKEKMLCALQLGVAMQLRSGRRKGEGMATGFDESQSVVDKGARR